jgi:hypothetical protein
MKKFLVSLIAVIVIALISANCTGPSVVYTGELQGKDTIVIVTQPGFAYEVRVIPKTINLKDDQAKYLIPPIFTRKNSILTPLADSDGGSYVLGPSKVGQDTIHISVIQPDGTIVTVYCNEGGKIPIMCGSTLHWFPCISDSVYDCDNY